jgi:hypothetical protein
MHRESLGEKLRETPELDCAVGGSAICQIKWSRGPALFLPPGTLPFLATAGPQYFISINMKIKKQLLI